MASENSRALSLDAHVKRINSQDKVATGVLTVIVGLVMLLVVAIIAYILVRGAGRALTPGFLTNPYNDDVLPGIVYQLWDSFYLLLVTLVISVPISLGAAIFLVEYAPDNWVTSAAKTAIETLSSLPSIVVGMFGSLFFVVTLGWKISILAGACALTMFNIPILVRTIQQALEDVPRSQRDAALAMGLTRWETTINVLLPAAMPAIVTGIVLSAGRVFGEAAALIFTAGSAPARLNFANPFNFVSPTCPFNIFRPACSLAVYIWRLTSEPTAGSTEIVWGTATVLLACVLLFNLLARLLGKLLSRRLTAE
ncbi:phosphate ABC transporter permease PstA [Thermophilibacter sp. ZX-H3]|uniref:phosphate ABC transporter permease PstA n=1 Tax=Atopobiaceae TaxID=1643824 RepID=UPI00143C9169|nr:phosphate ABC transporter permease PstA [Olsenella sp. SW781]NJE80041.1 phosphate ABC transporter permease PstA [Olsenella sp. SW781]